MIRCVFGCCYIMVFAGNEIDVYIIFIYKWVRSAEWGLRSKDKDGYTHTHIYGYLITRLCVRMFVSGTPFSCSYHFAL